MYLMITREAGASYRKKFRSLLLCLLLCVDCCWCTFLFLFLLYKFVLLITLLACPTVMNSAGLMSTVAVH